MASSVCSYSPIDRIHHRDHSVFGLDSNLKQKLVIHATVSHDSDRSFSTRGDRILEKLNKSCFKLLITQRIRFVPTGSNNYWQDFAKRPSLENR